MKIKAPATSHQWYPSNDAPRHDAVELLVDCTHELAEGPVWFAEHLYWVDINRGTFNRWSWVDQLVEQRLIGAPLGNVVPRSDGTWNMARQHSLERFDWVRGTMECLHRLETDLPTNRFNDGKCDPLGRWLIGSMNTAAPKEPTASLYSVAEPHTCRRLLNGLTLSNGLGWSPDGNLFYHIDSVSRRVDMHDYDLASGELGPRRTLTRIAAEDGLPDGMTVDAEGHVWVALWGGGAVVRLHGRDGHEMSRLRLPTPQVTSCTFGGPDLKDLFITTAATGLSAAQRDAHSGAGGIFHARPGVLGLPTHYYRH